mgnify:CR=1 FL=1
MVKQIFEISDEAAKQINVASASSESSDWPLRISLNVDDKGKFNYLMGEHDGNPKDPNWLYRMHLALGDYRQAARTQVIIAKQEQEQGNYKVAHKLLHDTFGQQWSDN